MTTAFVALVADRVEPGPLVWVAGALQQTTRLFMGGACVCTLLVSYPEGSPEYCKAARVQTLDGMPARTAEAITS